MGEGSHLETIHTVADLRARLHRESSIALVPTMGNLHAGHIALLQNARARASCVIASIFVNRLQFEPGGDFDRYPRTLDSDRAVLERAGCDVVFAPEEREMYPAPQEIVVSPPKAAAQLCGDFRPGHFEGVLTVVTKLFHIVRPTVAVFGKKDYQQLFVVRELVKQLNFGIEIVGVATVREADGLALSSRNGYLSAAERAQAMRLSQNLARIKASLEAGERDLDALTGAAMQDLRDAGWKVDYIAVRNQLALAVPDVGDRDLVVLGAAWLGSTRLIDNVEVAA